MRRSWTVLFGSTLLMGIATGAFAQTAPSALPPPEFSVIEAFTELRASPSLTLSLDATETYLGRGIRTQSTVKWVNSVESGRDVARVEVTVWTAGTLVQRVVCDGQTVWNYDARRNRYSAQPIDRSTGTQANTYRVNLESALNEAVGGNAADVLHLAREIAGSTTSTHRAWIPGVKPVAGDKPWQGRWAIYDLPTGQPKTVTFEISDAGGVASLDRVHRTGSTRVGGNWRTIEEVIEIDATPVEATSPAFLFVPPSNAVSVPARAVKF